MTDHGGGQVGWGITITFETISTLNFEVWICQFCSLSNQIHPSPTKSDVYFQYGSTRSRFFVSKLKLKYIKRNVTMIHSPDYLGSMRLVCVLFLALDYLIDNFGL